MGTGLNGSKEALIENLAKRFHVLPRYVDATNQVRKTKIDSVLSVLNAMGVRTESTEDLKAALTEREKAFWSRLVDPILVVRLGSCLEDLHIRLKLEDPEATHPPPTLALNLTLTYETGQKINQASFRGADLRLLEKRVLEEGTFGLFSVPFPSLPGLGYYRLRLKTNGEDVKSAVMKVVVTPEKAYLPPALEGEGRLAGLWVSLYGLRSEHDWGIGDFGDLKRLGLWAGKQLKVSFIGISPVHSLFNRGNGISPYSPVTRLYRNFLYLDIPSMEDFVQSKRAVQLISSAEIGQLIEELRGLEEVDYARVAALKRKVLRVLFDDFLEGNVKGGRAVTRRGIDFQEYMEREEAFLEGYATFAALDHYFHSKDPEIFTWAQWPDAYRRPEGQAVEEFRQEHQAEILFEKYLQWQIALQLEETQRILQENGLPLGIYHDLAMSDDPYGSELWAHPELFVEGVSIGAPPDEFSQKGQDWGFPAPDMEKMREDGYRFFIQELRNNFRHGGCIRMDHVMRLFHYYWIVEGKEPKDGAYVAARHDELLGILALESVRNRILVVGEDLGTVQPYVREALNRYGIFSYRLLYFEKEENGDFKSPLAYPSTALATVTTHDLPTLCGFWRDADIEERKTLGLFPNEAAYAKAVERRREDKESLLKALSEEGLMHPGASTNPGDYPEVTGELHNAVVGYLARSRAKLMQLNQEDLFKDLRQQNMPGTTAERSNWVTRMQFRTDELDRNAQVVSFAQMFRNWIIQSNRCPPRSFPSP